jgi:hypothetical protein
MKQLFIVLSFLFVAFSYADGTEPYHGLWKGKDGNSVGYISLGENDYAYFIIAGDTLGGESFVVDGIEGSMKYEVVEVANSVYDLDFIVYVDGQEVSRMLGIFKVTGTDEITLSVNFDANTRPQTFNEGEKIVLERE